MAERKLIATIGLEIHAELKTASKMFCSCKNDPDEEKPNANICPICMGHPGTLPVLNIEAIRHVLKMGHALNGIIANFTEWDRKNYFYPDIPKGYQISQYKYPLVTGGSLSGVELTRIHLEEDTAQSTHDLHEKSLVNFNRAGVPLMELVTEPVIHDALTAVTFAKELQLLLRYIGAGDANMEKGEMRVEANISVASLEDTQARKFGTKTEVKNLNSFKVVEKAIAYEIERQTELLARGEKVIQETRGWDEDRGETYSQRKKESSHDYRYFPEPDIPKMKIEEVPELRKEVLVKELPELPWVKRERYLTTYAMTEKEVAVFVENQVVAAFFEQVISTLPQDKKAIDLAKNYILTDYLGTLKKEGKNIDTISSENFSKIITMIIAQTISSRGAKDIITLLVKEGGDPEKVALEKGLIQKNDEGELLKIVEKIVLDNPTAHAEFKGGKIASLQFFIGQGMKATKGSANPELLKKTFLEVLNR